MPLLQKHVDVGPGPVVVVPQANQFVEKNNRVSQQADHHQADYRQLHDLHDPLLKHFQVKQEQRQAAQSQSRSQENQFERGPSNFFSRLLA
jgi:hypothetical protein